MHLPASARTAWAAAAGQQDQRSGAVCEEEEDTVRQTEQNRSKGSCAYSACLDLHVCLRDSRADCFRRPVHLPARPGDMRNYVTTDWASLQRMPLTLLRRMLCGQGRLQQPSPRGARAGARPLGLPGTNPR